MKRSFYLSGLLFCSFMLSFMSTRASVLSIPANPANDTVCSGSNARFIIGAVDTPGSPSLTYSWIVSTDGGSTWSSAGASTSDTLIVSATVAMNGYWYKGIAADGTNADTSAAALLVVDTLNAGTITGLSSVCIGSNITLADAISGGVWSASNAHATVSSGIVTGVSHGFDTVKYTVTNKCGTIAATASVRVDTTVVSLPITGPTVTCTGHFIDLMNVNVLGSHTWSGNTGNATIAADGTLTGLAYGNDTITYNFTNACNSVSSTYDIHVDTPLAAGVISGTATLCAGSDISLSETVSGGTWLSSNSGIAVVDGSGTVTGVAQGSVIISYFLSNGCGASVATFAMTIEGIAAPISGPDSVGIGDMITLVDTTSGGTWSTSNTSIDSIGAGTGVVTGRAIGTSTIVYTVTNTCGTTSASITMNVGNHPSISAITGGDSVCIGSTVTLSDVVSGGTWSVKNANATVDNAGVVTGVTYGMDTVYYSVTTGFGTTVVSTTVFVNQPPVITISGPVVIALGGDYFPMAQPAGGTWTNRRDNVGQIVASSVFYDTLINSIRYPVVSYCSYIVVGFGKDTIIYTDHNTCGTRSDSLIVNLPLPAVTNGVAAVPVSLHIYPNPNQGAFVLNLSSGDDKATVTITNVVGEKVKELNIPTNKNIDIKLDAPAGLYLINAVTATGNYSSKVTITK